ncbi:Prolipoprotein diacylglyceryl transferase [Candidatus Syntrophocurvum alkaliphilum]|uniref:Phosphatidylglycerol--prolipoprotein diacylglyceryl transferase n=1 Tax=Candidatus Syntrophocurvum alkaliphilum TaxID=2293317 RepID=A0A6I6DB89_9FIRM|nr:prolipoprotein diacylglyceryl transferase [Candidatus Syntrophocurvum alkaliphilum]QGT98754.1 Prolipoprotein diacylglyceryl transferase [Candidatus Syntrophocurvum alkaliphilum]
MQPVLFEIGSVEVYAWGTMLAIAVIIGITGVRKLFEKEGLDKEIVIDMVIVMVVAGIIGSRLGYILLYELDTFLENPLMFFYLSSGGLIWYGALIFGFLAFLFFIIRKGLDFWKTADIFAPFVALGYAIVRIGCFLNGCCYGEVTESALGVVFPFVDNLLRHPTQLYATVLNLILFLFLIWFYPRRRFSGQVFLLYLIGYSIYRFTVDFYRFNLIEYGILSLGHIYVILMFVVVVGVYYVKSIRHKEGD